VQGRAQLPVLRVILCLLHAGLSSLVRFAQFSLLWFDTENMLAHPASCPVDAQGALTPGNEADHSPPSSGGVKNVWSYTSAPPIRVLMNHTDIFDSCFVCMWTYTYN